MKSMTKKRTAQTGARGIKETALGYTIKARPGPGMDAHVFYLDAQLQQITFTFGLGKIT